MVIAHEMFKNMSVVLLLLLFTLFGMGSAFAQSTDQTIFQQNCSADQTEFCRQANEVRGGGNSVLGPNGILTKAAQIIVYLTGAISVIMVIIGGFRYVLSGGDSNATKGAKDTIMYALVGLVVAIFSQTIVTFVLSKL